VGRLKYIGQKIRVVTAEIRREGRYLITQRQPTATLPLLWEFPGGKVGRNEEPEEALARLLTERLGVDCEVGELVMEVVHEYEHYSVDMQVYRCEIPIEQEIKAKRVHAFRWVAPADFSAHTFPGADEETISKLLELDEDEFDVN
jgi:8-oxo-dGTP diphosphatase